MARELEDIVVEKSVVPTDRLGSTLVPSVRPDRTNASRSVELSRSVAPRRAARSVACVPVCSVLNWVIEGDSLHG